MNKSFTVLTKNLIVGRFNQKGQNLTVMHRMSRIGGGVMRPSKIELTIAPSVELQVGDLLTIRKSGSLDLSMYAHEPNVHIAIRKIDFELHTVSGYAKPFPNNEHRQTISQRVGKAWAFSGHIQIEITAPILGRGLIELTLLKTK
jgi:hypothetical protein